MAEVPVVPILPLVLSVPDWEGWYSGSSGVPDKAVGCSKACTMPLANSQGTLKYDQPRATYRVQSYSGVIRCQMCPGLVAAIHSPLSAQIRLLSNLS